MNSLAYQKVTKYDQSQHPRWALKFAFEPKFWRMVVAATTGGHDVGQVEREKIQMVKGGKSDSHRKINFGSFML